MTTRQRPPMHRRPRDADATRTALVGAAARLLPVRAPSAITGRELAAEAGVNYGLVHHHFGGKDGVLQAGLVALRNDFIARFGDGAETPFLGLDSHPYLRAIVRSHLDEPELPRADDEYPIGSALVRAVGARLAASRSVRPDEVSAEAQAGAIAAAALQIGYGVFGSMLLEATGVVAGDRAGVERHLASIYEMLIARTPNGSRTPDC